jgi:hypothetical protein
MTILRQDIEVIRGKRAAFQVDASALTTEDFSNGSNYDIRCYLYDQRLSADPVDIQSGTTNLATGKVDVAINSVQTYNMSPLARYEVSVVLISTGAAVFVVRGKIICPKTMHASVLNADNSIVLASGDSGDTITGITYSGDVSELGADD